MSNEKAKERQDYLFNEMAALLTALASPVRLKIIHFLSQAPHSVEQLSVKLGQTIANTSMHLNKMHRENILKSESVGQKRIYSLSQKSVQEFWEQIQHFAHELNPANVISSVDLFNEDLDWKKSISETVKRIKSKKLTILDVRPLDETDQPDLNYKKYVINVPFDQLKKMKNKIPSSFPVLVICRGRLCVKASESTFQLKKLGFDAYQLGMSWYELSKKLN